MISRLLSSDSEIDAAERLIKEIYLDEQNWNIPKDNPSKIRVEGAKITDRFKEIAKWIGVFEGDRILGTIRCIESPNLEIDQYLAFNKNKMKDPLIEINRLAVAKDHRNSQVFSNLLLCAFDFCEKQGAGTILCTAKFPDPGNLLMSLGFIIAHEDFKFHPSDPYKVKLLQLNFTDKLANEKLRNNLRR